jgi:hypothetical protein
VNPLQASDPGKVGPYRLLALLGEGGMGRVYLGESPSGRRVAIKVIQPGLSENQGFRLRFAREVAAARQVGGFHTAAVVDADTDADADAPWMATAYIPGPSLAAAVAEHGPLDAARVRDLGAALAEGLGAIHACGIIHRDLKPGNVILAGDGPRIIDFGIAKGAGATSLTEAHEVAGTLNYMSPEQLNRHELTPKSDVFALGGVLAFAATGHAAFRASAVPAIIARILHAPPDLDPPNGCPLDGDLRDVLSACLAKDPGSRPSTGDLLARLSALSAASTPAPSVTRRPAPRPRRVPGREGPPAAVPKAGNRRRRRAAAVATAVTAIAVLAVLAVLGILQPWDSPVRPVGPLVSATGSLAATLALSEVTNPDVYGQVSYLVAIDPAGKILAMASNSIGKIALSTVGGKPIATLSATQGSLGVVALAFAPGGATLAASDRNGTTFLWNTARRKVAGTLSDPRIPATNALAFSPHGAVSANDTVLAAGGSNGRTDLWATSTGKVTTVLTDPEDTGSVTAVAFSPDGARLAIGFGNGNTDLWNTATKKITARCSDPQATGGVSALAFSADGSTLAAGDQGGATELCDTASGQAIATLAQVPDAPANPAAVTSVEFAPNGAVLASSDSDGNTDLWDVAARQATATLADPDSRGITSAALSPDGSTLTAADSNGSAYLWKITYRTP